MLASSVHAPQQPRSHAAACRSAAPAASAAPPAASLRSRNATVPRALRCASHAALATQHSAAAFAPRCRRRAAPASRRSAVAPVAAIKAITSFDGSFTLEPEADAQLRGLLGSATFRSQVASERGWQLQGAETPAVNFTGRLFAPAPWTPTTKLGMPAELEPLAKDTERYVFINVPYNFMFTCKIANPARLCAVFERADAAAA